MFRLLISSTGLSRKAILSLALLFFALALIVYGRSLTNDFVRFDDGLLIYENPAAQGFSVRSLVSAFTTFDPELYIPLTLITYQFEYLLSGTHPFLYHLNNFILHIINALLVSLFLFLLTKQRSIALYSGLLFLMHPLHTEAIAWASARKDVLSAFFFFASLISYMLHQSDDNPSRRSALFWSIAFFLLGLMSKVMVITLPVILILLDYVQSRSITHQSLKEKIPYIILAIVFGVIALIGKSGITSEMTLSETMLMSFMSTMTYLMKLLVPLKLSVLYPYTGEITLASKDFFIPMIAVFLLALITMFVWYRGWRLITFGFTFFIITLIPTFINFAKDGDYYFASDRYAYIPSVGIILIFSWLLMKISSQRMFNFPFSLFTFIAVCILLPLGVLAHSQSLVWKDSESLFRNVLAHYPNSHRAHNNMGNVLRREGDLDGAIIEFEQALSISERPKTLSNLGAVYRKQGKILDALTAYRRAIEIDISDPEPYFGLGLVYAQTGDTAQALESYDRALELNPAYSEVMNNIGALEVARGNYEEGIKQYERAIIADPTLIMSYYNLGIALAKSGRIEEAIEKYEWAIHLRHDFIGARINLGILYYDAGRTEDAERMFRSILSVDPENQTAISALRQMGAM